MTAIGSHPVQWGDTLSQIARDYDTTIGALMAANDQIVDPNLIYAGDTLIIPGASAPGANGGRVDAPGIVHGLSPANGNNAAAIAEQFIGRNAGELKYSGELPMETWVPDNLNCANFVSACLQQAGMIDAGQASASVDVLGNNLSDAGWRETSLQNARPGDVVLMQSDGQSHVVLFAGFENGQPRFIGSNNINADGSQQISWGGASGNYRILTPPG